MTELAAHPLVTASTALLVLFAALSLIDGLYIHLWKLRLHSRRESYREHLWHTGRAILFAPALVLLFAAPTAGAVLWLGITVVVVEEVLEILDVVSERGSRTSLGGLSSLEYAIHVVLITLRAAAVALALASRPAAAWSLDAPSVLGAHPRVVEVLVEQLVPGAIIAAALHVWLAWRYRPARHAVAA